MNKKKSIKNKNEFLNYMLDLLEPMGELSYKPLFGGYVKMGIYRHRTSGYWNSDWESLQDQTVYYDSIVFRKPKKNEKLKNK